MRERESERENSYVLLHTCTCTCTCPIQKRAISAESTIVKLKQEISTLQVRQTPSTSLNPFMLSYQMNFCMCVHVSIVPHITCNYCNGKQGTS